MKDQFEMEWFEFTPAPGCKIKAPDWAMLVGLHEDGRVFVPAAVLGNERQVVLAALFDGDVDVVVSDSHAYLPTEWVQRQDPTLIRSFENIRRKLRGRMN